MWSLITISVTIVIYTALGMLVLKKTGPKQEFLMPEKTEKPVSL